METEKEILVKKLGEDVGCILQWISNASIHEIWVRKKAIHENQELTMTRIPQCNLDIVESTLVAMARFLDLIKEAK